MDADVAHVWRHTCDGKRGRQPHATWGWKVLRRKDEALVSHVCDSCTTRGRLTLGLHKSEDKIVHLEKRLLG